MDGMFVLYHLDIEMCCYVAADPCIEIAVAPGG